jgi:hypothetical protein
VQGFNVLGARLEKDMDFWQCWEKEREKKREANNKAMSFSCPKIK